MLRIRLTVLLLLFTFSFRSTYGIDEIPQFYRLLKDAKAALVSDPKRALTIIDTMKSIMQPGDAHFELLTCEIESQANFYAKNYLATYHTLCKIDSLLQFENDQQRLAVNYNRLGVLFTEWGLYEKALENLLKSYQIRIRLGHPDPIMFTLNSMSRLYLEMGLDSLALETIQKAIGYRQFSVDTFNRAHISMAAGHIYEQLGMYDSAIHYYLQTVNERTQINNYQGIIEAYNALSQVRLKENNTEEALSYSVKALEWQPMVEDESYLYQTYLTLMEIALRQSNEKIAMLYARKIQDRVNDIPNQSSRKKAYKLLSNVYEVSGDTRNALWFARQYEDLQDSLLSQFRANTQRTLEALRLMNPDQGLSSKETKKNSTFYTIPPEFFLVIGSILIFFFLTIILQYRKIRRLETSNQYLNQYNTELSRKTELLQTEADQRLEENRTLKNQINSGDKKITTDKTLSHAELASIYERVLTMVKIAGKLNQEQYEKEKIHSFHEKLYSLSLLLHQRIKNLLYPTPIKDIVQPNPQDFEMNEWLLRLEKNIKNHQDENRNVGLTFFPSSLVERVIVHSNPDLLQELILTLLAPSLQNHEKGEVQISIKTTGTAIQCIINDTRNSLPSEYRSLVSEWQLPSFQSSNVDISKQNIAVFNACRIAVSLGVKLVFEDSGESGMMFSFTIPVEAEGMETLREEVPDWSEKHILIAEDDQVIYETIRNFLKPTKAKISHAKTGIEIIEYVKAVKFDVILMDIKMPRMDGIDALSIIRQTHHSLPVVACTAHASYSERDNFLQMGFADLLVKPISRKQLYQSLEPLVRIVG